MLTPAIIFNRTKDTASSTREYLINPNECKSKDDAKKYLQRQLLNAHIEGLNQAISVFSKFTVKSHILDEIIAERAELIQFMRTL